MISFLSTNIVADSIALDENYLFRLNGKRIMKQIDSLKPNEKRTMRYDLTWDKTRYYQKDDYEYYIDENKRYFLQIIITLLKEEFKNKLMPADYQKIENNTDFIKGTFVSNEMLIDFSN